MAAGKQAKPSGVLWMLLALVIAGGRLYPWSNPVRITGAAGVSCLKPVVQFSPTGKMYVMYKAGRDIHLSSYDGERVAFEENLSRTSLIGYEGYLYINRRGHMHAVWIEAANYGANTQHVRYRSNTGSGWSAASTLLTLDIPGVLPGGHVTTKVEDLRIAVDENDNVFIAFMVWPAAKCKFISKYGGAVSEETWPMTGRSKHPDVAVDAGSVHIAWQQLWGNNYTIAYSRRANKQGARWEGVIDVKDGNHRPRLTVDPNRVLHITAMDDYNAGIPRDTYYKYWTGNGFSNRYLISDDGARAYHEIWISAVNSGNILISEWAGRTVYVNWKQNGQWSGHKKVPLPNISPGFASSALSASGMAVIAVVDGDSAIYLTCSQGGSPDPDPDPDPDPEPEPEPNVPPSAFFVFAPASGLYPLNVAFNASNSKDSDGSIVSYRWNFGDGRSGTGMTANHVYGQPGRYRITLTVTDDDGATATAGGEVEAFGLAPPLNLQYQRHENRNLFSIEYLYRVTWDANPRNHEIGAEIMVYKIYRREIGMGGFAHFCTVPAGGQSSFEYLDRSLGATARTFEYAISAVDSAGRESPRAPDFLFEPQAEDAPPFKRGRFQADMNDISSRQGKSF